MSAGTGMWVSSAPLRISLAGGGTDLPGYALRFGGTVLGAGTDLRVTVVGRRARRSTGIRVCLDSCGHAESAQELANPFAREAMLRHWDGTPLDLFSTGDVPGATGMGSSAAFCVSLVAGLSTEPLDASSLARAASDIEIQGLGRPVGRQDHYLSALGGFRLLHFHRDGTVEVEDVAVLKPGSSADSAKSFFSSTPGPAATPATSSATRPVERRGATGTPRTGCTRSRNSPLPSKTPLYRGD
ncbi:hypothetical protein HEP87_37895 [Streptomyces sp. S1D4-11]